MKRNSSKPALQQTNSLQTLPTTSTMVTNTKNPFVIIRKLASTISSGAKAQSITLNKPTSDLIVSQSKISVSPSKMKSSASPSKYFIPAKCKTSSPKF